MTSYGQLFRPEIPWDVVRDVVLAGVLRRPNEARMWAAGQRAVADGCSLAIVWRSLTSGQLSVVATDLALMGSPPRFTQPEVQRVPAELSSWLVGVDGERVLEARAAQFVVMAPLDIAREPWPRQLDLIAVDATVLGRDPVGHADRVERLAGALRSHSWLLVGGALADSSCLEGRFTTIDARGIYRKRE